MRTQAQEDSSCADDDHHRCAQTNPVEYRNLNDSGVVLTTSREQRDIYHCYRLGIDSYIVKRVNLEEFRDRVRIPGDYWLVLNQSAIR